MDIRMRAEDNLSLKNTSLKDRMDEAVFMSTKKKLDRLKLDNTDLSSDFCRNYLRMKGFSVDGDYIVHEPWVNFQTSALGCVDSLEVDELFKVGVN